MSLDTRRNIGRLLNRDFFYLLVHSPANGLQGATHD
jgi:hypothetical protein